MKQENTKADFILENFKFTEFFFKEPSNDVDNLNMDFETSGDYSSATGQFNLNVGFKSMTSISEVSIGEVVFSTHLKATFIFPDRPSFVDLPSFFYGNSIAIVYPYLRAFVSNLTLQANTKLLILPILNLSALEQKLRDNTKEIL